MSRDDLSTIWRKASAMTLPRMMVSTFFSPLRGIPRTSTPISSFTQDRIMPRYQAHDAPSRLPSADNDRFEAL